MPKPAPKDLETLIVAFCKQFQSSKRPTNLRDPTTAKLFAQQLAKEIRRFAVVRKRV